MRAAAAVLAAMAWLAAPVSVAALDADQKAAVDKLAAETSDAAKMAAGLARHYAILLWVEDYCNGASSATVRAYLQQKGTVDSKAFDDGWADTVELLAKTDAKAMCALAVQLYGPDGTLIRGGWQARAG